LPGLILFLFWHSSPESGYYALAVSAFIFITGLLQSFLRQRNFLLGIVADVRGLEVSFLSRHIRMKHFSEWEGVKIRRCKTFSFTPTPMLFLGFSNFGKLRFYSRYHPLLPPEKMEELIARLEELKRSLP
jgi:hypothetical protein